MNQKLNIIIIEDLASDAELMMFEIKKGGLLFNATIVDNAEDFTNALMKFNPDIILSDYSLPCFDGVHALSIKQEIFPNIPFILVTGSLNEETAVEVMKAGADDYIIKDRIFRLVPAIQSALEKKAAAQKKDAAETALRLSEEKYHFLVENTADTISLLNLDLNYTYISPSIYKLRGFTIEEAMKQTFQDAITPESFKDASDLLSYELSLEATGNADPERTRSFEIEAYCKDGSKIWVDNSIKFVRDNDGKITGLLAISKDITDRKKAELALFNLNRNLKAINYCNQALLRAVDEDSLLNEICRIICAEAGYLIAWVGYAEFDKNKTLTLAAHSGSEFNMFFNHKITWSENEKIHLSAGQAVRTGKTSIIQDLANVSKSNINDFDRMNVGFHSSISIPIKDYNLNIFGVLNIYSSEKNIFTPDEIQLLEGLASDLSFGISTIRTRLERIKAENSLSESYNFNLNLLRTIPFGMNIIDEQGVILFINENFEKFFGRNTIGKTCWSIYRTDNSPCLNCPVIKGIEIGVTATHEVSGIIGDKVFEVSHTGMMFQGKKAVLEIFHDITNRKKTEAKLVEREHLSQSLLRLSKFLEHVTNYSEIMNAARDEIITVVGYKNLWAYVISEDRKYAHVLVAKGPLADKILNEKEIATLTIESDPMLQEIVEAKSITIVEDARSDWRTNKDIVKLLDNRTIINIPMILYDKNLGSLGTGTFGGEGIKIPTELQFEYLSSIASQLAVTFDRIHLFNELQKLIETSRESEERIRTLFETTPGAIFVLDSSTSMILDCNEEAGKMYGYTKDELIGTSFSEISASNNFSEIFADFVDRLKTVKSIKQEDWHVNKNGVLFPVDSTTSLVIVSGKEVLLSIVQDITERKRVENVIIESEKKFKDIANLLPQSVFETDINGVITFANQATLSMFGYSQEDILNNITIMDLISDKDKENSLENINRVLDGLPSIRNEFEMKRNDGTIFPTLTFSTAIIENDKCTGLRGTIVDLSRQKQIENELRKLSEAVAQSQLSIMITDTLGNIEYVNPYFSVLTGYQKEEILNKNPRVLKSGETNPGEYKQMWKKITSGTGWSGVFHNKKKNGELYWESVIITPIKNEEGVITNFIAVKEDITDKVEKEKELKKYREHLEELVETRTKELDKLNADLVEQLKKEKELELMLRQSLEKEKELNELKTRFISTASHEFRTPLTTILASAEMIQRYGKKWDETKYNDYFNKIKKSIDYLTKLMDDVLTINRSESSKILFNPVLTNLYKICLEISEGTKSVRDEKHEFVFNYSAKKVNLILDPKLFKFLISNLISNAFKYSPEGGKVEFSVSSSRELIHISISDEGIGIPEDDIKHLFEPFHRGTNTVDIPGTGLGLSIVKHAVEMHNGKISVNSKIGKGTIFTVEIPVRSK
jgi:PAS domain S-box-containing protein